MCDNGAELARGDVFLTTQARGKPSRPRMAAEHKHTRAPRGKRWHVVGRVRLGRRTGDIRQSPTASAERWDRRAHVQVARRREGRCAWVGLAFNVKRFSWRLRNRRDFLLLHAGVVLLVNLF